MSRLTGAHHDFGAKIMEINPRTQIISPPWYNGGGEGGWLEHSLELLICFSISKRFYLQWKAFDLLNKMRYILLVVTLLEVCNVTNNGHHLEFYQELEVRLKPREIVIICACAPQRKSFDQTGEICSSYRGFGISNTSI